MKQEGLTFGCFNNTRALPRARDCNVLRNSASSVCVCAHVRVCVCVCVCVWYIHVGSYMVDNKTVKPVQTFPSKDEIPTLPHH